MDVAPQQEQSQARSWPRAGEAEREACPPVLFQQGTHPHGQPSLSPVLSCLANAQGFISPLGYCNIPAEPHLWQLDSLLPRDLPSPQAIRKGRIGPLVVGGNVLLWLAQQFVAFRNYFNNCE